MRTEDEIRREIVKLLGMSEVDVLHSSKVWFTELPWRVKALKWVLNDAK